MKKDNQKQGLRAKLNLSRETLRVLNESHLRQAAGGGTSTTLGPTTSLTDGTTPYPSHGPCSLDTCGNSGGYRCY